MSILIIDYGSGNLRSCVKAFEHAAESTSHHVVVSSDAADLKNASHIVLPGVGAFGDCMRGLSELPGMLEAMEREVREKQKPFFGICVGMQMLFERGFEHGEHAGLGWMEGEVVALKVPRVSCLVPNEHSPDTDYKAPATNHQALKIPHMGWNDLQLLQPRHPALGGIKNGEHVYFVHSYHAQCKNKTDMLAAVDYGQTIAALIGRDNILGAQFHPEKSQRTGLQLIGNFLKMG